MRRTLDIVNDLANLEYEEKRIFQYLAEYFDDNEPHSFYDDYYELTSKCTGSTPLLWEQFLDIPEIKHYKEVKLAKLWEFDAAKAMRALQKKGNSSRAGDIAALKEIIERSKLLQANYKSKQTIILTHIPKKDYEKDVEV